MTMTARQTKLTETRRLLLDFTGDRMERGVPEDSGYCAVALTIKEMYPWAKHVSVDWQTIRLSDPRNGMRYIYFTPREVQNFIAYFDQRMPHGGHPPFKVFLRIGQAIKMQHARRGPVPPKEEFEAPFGRDEDGKAKAPYGLRVDGKPRKRQLMQFIATSSDHSIPTTLGGSPPPMPPPYRRRHWGLRLDG